ncbi:MAG: DUF3617 family protein [Rhodocyclaceae bacterium]|nr:DUF3617 family protein [Pseudomonadota bacterium]MDQ7975128.1 DUF3617 family protein [Rhodocyclaceae bacterium]MDQ8002876.1 DUF3617 family protein [Pseudomonadota bacterium]
MLLLPLAALATHALAGPTFPERKAGWWEMRSTPKTGARDSIVVQQCADPATDKALQEYGLSQPKMNRKFCKEEMRNEAGKMLVHTEVCRQSETTMTRRIVMSGDFNAAYRVESHTVYDPAPKVAPRDDDMVAEMRWLGACPAGMKAGDMMLPGGMKTNIADLTAMGAMAGKIMRTGPDARPGEMTLPDGTKVDMEAMKRMAEQMNRQMAQQPRAAGK